MRYADWLLLTYAIFLISVIGVAFAFSLSAIKNNGKLFIFIVPTLLLVSLVGIHTAPRLLGAPTSYQKDREFVVLEMHKTGGDMFIWLIYKGNDQPTSVRISITPENEKKLNEAMAKRKNGIITGKFKKSDKGNSSSNLSGEKSKFGHDDGLEFMFNTPQQLWPKD